jgi:membrane protein
MQKLIKFYFFAAKRLFKEGYTYRSSALAYTTLLSLVPLLSIALVLLTFFPIFTDLINLTSHFLAENFLPATGSNLQSYLQQFINQAVNLPGISILFLIISGILLFITIDNVINTIWQSEFCKISIIAFICRWLLMALLPFVIGAGVFLASSLFSAKWFIAFSGELWFKIPYLVIFSVALNTLIFAIFYVVVPRCKVRWRDGFLGGITTALLFELAKFAFAIYVQQFARYTLIYGALAIVPIFLIWLYICWFIILYGALLTYESYKWR